MDRESTLSIHSENDAPDELADDNSFRDKKRIESGPTS